MQSEEGKLGAMAAAIFGGIIAAILVPRHSILLRVIGAFAGFGGLLYGLWWAYRSRREY